VPERWQSSEARTAAVFFRDATGVPVTGLTPAATVAYKDGTAGAPTATVTAVSGGFYRLTFSAPLTKDVLVLVDGGGTLTTTRYAALEVPVGGYVDNDDVAISTRATHAEATGDTAGTTTLLSRLTGPRAVLLDNLSNLDAAVSVLTGRLSAARAVLLDNLDAPISTLTGRLTAARALLLDNLSNLDAPVTTLTGRLTAARALLLDNLASLDVAVSSRATHAEATTDTAGTTTLLGRLSGARAALLDNLNATVSSRATPADVAITVNPVIQQPPSVRGEVGP
jgi:hypothetical protein